MWKWIGRLVSIGIIGLLIGIIGLVVFTIYDYHRAGYFSMPDLKDDEYPIVFRSGFRAIVIDPDISDETYENAPQLFRRLRPANPDRKYLGVPSEVPSWFEDAWSYCEKPDEAESEAVFNTMPDDMRRELMGARLDAVCTIDSDEKKILRGLLFSVPKL